MAVRRRQAVASERGPLMWGAVGLLEFDDYRRRAGAIPPGETTERRQAVERVLTPDELAVVDRIVGRDLPAKQHDALLARLGPKPDAEDLIAMWGQILGHEPRYGR